MVPGVRRFTCMNQKIRESNVLSVLHRERLILAGFAVNLGAVAMAVLHQG